MTLLKAGSGVDRNLSSLGESFRRKLGDLRFDRFLIELKEIERAPSDLARDVGE